MGWAAPREAAARAMRVASPVARPAVAVAGRARAVAPSQLVPLEARAAVEAAVRDWRAACGAVRGGREAQAAVVELVPSAAHPGTPGRWTVACR